MSLSFSVAAPEDIHVDLSRCGEERIWAEKTLTFAIELNGTRVAARDRAFERGADPFFGNHEMLGGVFSRSAVRPGAVVVVGAERFDLSEEFGKEKLEEFLSER